MKMLAQHGALCGDKITDALELGYVDGAIFSPRDISVRKLEEQLNKLAEVKPESERLVDPQFYASGLVDDDSSRLGFLAGDDYPYFEMRRLAQLETEAQIQEDLTNTLQFQQRLNISTAIAPNIVIRRSLSSAESVIAKNFIRNTAARWANFNYVRPIFATLSISVEALMDLDEFLSFVNDLTVITPRPHGFYLLVSLSKVEDARYALMDPRVISRVMFLVHALSINGYEVVVGYSDLLSPLYGAVGARAGASGWWSNTRVFSLERFEPEKHSSSRPIPRYLSLPLWNRIKFGELAQLVTLGHPVLNQIESDRYFDSSQGFAPITNGETFQGWSALKELTKYLVADNDLQGNLTRISAQIKTAQNFYRTINVRLDPKSSSEHLEPMLQSLPQFATLAEEDFPG